MGKPEERWVPPPWQRAAALVFVNDLVLPELSDEDAHHLGKVLRLRAGSEVCASDGQGSWTICEWNGGSSLVPTDESGCLRPLDPELCVGFAIVKGDRPELVVQKLTELGIDRILMFESSRSVVRWDHARRERNIDRLRRIAIGACRQSRRLHLPTIDFEDLVVLVDRGLSVADFGGRPIDRSDTAVLIGPEGGWDDSEIKTAPRVSLSENVLRAETASIVAAGQMAVLRHAAGLGQSQL